MYSVWRSLLGLLKLTLGSSVVKNKRFKLYIHTHTSVCAAQKQHFVFFMTPLASLTDPNICIFPSRCCSLWCWLPGPFGHSVRCTDSTLYFPPPFHVLIMRFPRTIWALYKTHACLLPVALLLFSLKILSFQGLFRVTVTSLRLMTLSSQLLLWYSKLLKKT